jgi:aspartyl-tRNA(Asn)/glutamyl-tRNA(Gln) amidotransferase subunit A
MDEFAFGSSTEYSGFGQKTHNPYDYDRVPGGTSGGSCACVSSGQVPFALGTDTGGSIRQPSSFCATVGLRPTYGLVSRFGIMPSTSSFDQAGPITHTIQDNQLILKVLTSDTTESDQTCLEFSSKNNSQPSLLHSLAPSLNTSVPSSLAPLKIGLPKEYFAEGLAPQVRAKFEQLVDQLKENHEVVEVSLKLSPHTLSVYYILQTVEAAANLERFDGVRYGKQADLDSPQEMFYKPRGEFLGNESKRRIMLGTYTSSAGYYDAYYNKACQVRELIRQDFLQAFEQVDVLIMPASPFPAFKIGENTSDPMAMYLADIMTVSHPIARVPGLVIPIGFVDWDNTSLPVGAQLVGPEQSEETLYELGKIIESLQFDESTNIAH